MLISISTMPAGKKYLEYTKKVQEFADFLHLDVCDGKYNSTTCFLPEYAALINDCTTIPLDCHLMTKTPLKYAKEYIKAGVNIVTAQLEAFETEKETEEFIKYVKHNNALVGLAVEPKTDIKRVLPYIHMLDVVLVMAVKTGASGQKFDNTVLSKIELLKTYIINLDYNIKIQVDGGITDKTAILVKNAGADIVVSGSFIYNSADFESDIKKLR